MDYAVKRLLELEIVKQGYLVLNNRRASSRRYGYPKCVRGRFSVHFNINSVLGGPNNNGIRLVACRFAPTGVDDDGSEKIAVNRHRNLADKIIHELPPVEVSFDARQLTNPKYRYANRQLNNNKVVQLEIIACKAYWLPKAYDQKLIYTLNRFLKRHVALKADLKAKFEALLGYCMHGALSDLFTIRNEGYGDDGLTLVLVLPDERFHLRKVLDDFTRADVASIDDDSLSVLAENERNILLSKPWRTRSVLTKYDEQHREPAPAGAQYSEMPKNVASNLVLHTPVAGPNNSKTAVYAATKSLGAHNGDAILPSSCAPQIVSLLKRDNPPVACRTRARQRLAVQVRTCPICFDAKHHNEFYELSKCRHSFCRDCLQQHITVKIKERSVKSAKCIALECQQLIEYDDVKKLVPRRVFEKFDKLLLELEIAAIDDVEICANKACNMQYVIDAANLTRAGYTTAQCPHCSDVLCLWCKRRLRGNAPHVCELKGERIQQVLDEYESVTTSAATRLQMEKIYGKQKLRNLRENRRSEREVEAKKKCPQCKAPCVKDEGCNKVTCVKCTTVWCWLCGSKIPADGYAHFNVAGGSSRDKCAGKSLEGAPGENRGVAAAGPASAENNGLNRILAAFKQLAAAKIRRQAYAPHFGYADSN